METTQRLQGFKMDFLVVFLLIIGIATPGEVKTNEQLEHGIATPEEMKTNEQLEQELNEFKIKFDNNEVEMKNMGMNMNNMEKNMNTMKQLIMKLGNNKVKAKDVDYEAKNIKTEMGDIRVTTEKKDGKNIKKIKLQTVAFHSFFCAYQSQWGITGDLTYLRMLLEEKNIPEASFNIASGQFIAGRTGVYRVDLSIGEMLSSRSTNPNFVYIKLNGEPIEESEIVSYLNTEHVSGESGGRSMMIRMQRGNRLNVYVDSTHALRQITFCISYEI